MAKTYADVQAQIARLQAEADTLRAKEVADVVGRIREAMVHYGLTLADLGLRAKRGGRTGSKAKMSRSTTAPKYSDGNGNVWGGRGPRPAWLRTALGEGRSLEEFATQGGGARETTPKGATPRKRTASATGKRQAKVSARSAKAGKRSLAGKVSASQASQSDSTATAATAA